MAIVTLVLWVITAVAGLSLLRTGGEARRLAASSERTSELAASVPVRTGALPLTAEGKPPPVPRVRVTAPPGEHSLLEFSHPALALTGLACWFMFVLVGYQLLAWIAFGVLVVTIGAGLGWLARSTRQARQTRAGPAGTTAPAGRTEPASPRWRFPARLIWLHGLTTAVSITLTVLTALSASRG